jgi:hypothetical protein
VLPKLRRQALCYFRHQSKSRPAGLAPLVSSIATASPEQKKKYEEKRKQKEEEMKRKKSKKLKKERKRKEKHGSKHLQ